MVAHRANMQEDHKNKANNGVKIKLANGSMYDTPNPQWISTGRESRDITSCNSKKDASQLLIFLNIKIVDEMRDKDFSKRFYESLELVVVIVIFLE